LNKANLLKKFAYSWQVQLNNYGHGQLSFHEMHATFTRTCGSSALTKD